MGLIEDAKREYEDKHGITAEKEKKAKLEVSGVDPGNPEVIPGNKMSEVYNSIDVSGLAGQYLPAFQNTYKDSGLDPQDVTPNLVHSAIMGMANSYATEYAKKNNGTMPSADKVKSFIGQTMTPTVIHGFLTGAGNVNSQAASYVQNETAQNPDTSKTDSLTSQMQSQFNDLYKTAETQGISNIEQYYVKPRQQLAANQAKMGVFNSPVSIYDDINLESSEANAIKDYLGGLATSKIGTGMDVLGLETNVAQQDKAAKQQATEFASTLDFSKQQVDNQSYQQMLDRQLALQLGQMQARASGDGSSAMQNTSLGIGAASTAAKIAALFF